MQAKTLCAHSLDALEKQLAGFRQTGFEPTLAIVFSTINIELKTIQGLFNRQKIEFIGCSSAGEIADAASHEEAITGLVFDLAPASWCIHSTDYDAATTYSAAFEAGQFAKKAFENPAMILLSGGIQVDAEKVVFGVKDGVGREFPFYGGLAGDNLGLNQTWAFSSDFLSDEGLVCLILDADRVEVKGMATSGWEAIGGVNEITKAEGNMVYEINGKPALDVFIEYFGFFSNLSNPASELNTLSAQYPLQIERENGIKVLRSPLFANNDDRSMMLAGGVRQGEKFRFSISPGFEVVEKTVDEYADFRSRHASPEAVLLFSCKGRHAALGPMIDDEIEGLYNHWKTPMAGFFTYGEIGNPRGGNCEFHNETCSLVLLRERT